MIKCLNIEYKGDLKEICTWYGLDYIKYNKRLHELNKESNKRNERIVFNEMKKEIIERQK